MRWEEALGLTVSGSRGSGGSSEQQGSRSSDVTCRSWVRGRHPLVQISKLWRLQGGKVFVSLWQTCLVAVLP